MQRFELFWTGHPAFGFTGELMESKTGRAGRMLFTLAGFQMAAPRAGYVLHIWERTRTHEHFDVICLETLDAYRKAFRQALLLAHSLQAATVAASRGVPVFN